MAINNSDARTPWWLLPNLLSLDAPLIAVLWQGLLAAETHSMIRLTGRVVLALSVWAIYIADRLLDVRDPSTAPRTARHRFYLRHRRFALWLLITIVIANGLLILFALRAAVLRTGLVALSAVVVYLTLLHARRRTVGGLAKEALVAALFTGGTFVVAWTGSDDPVVQLWQPAVAFFLLCLANLTLLTLWESREDAAPQHPALQHWSTRTLTRAYPIWVALLVLCCVWHGATPWYRAIACSGIGSLGLYLAGTRISLDLRRVLADVVLLTPLLFEIGPR